MLRIYRIMVFDQTLIITGEGDYENQTIDIFKTVNPVLAL